MKTGNISSPVLSPCSQQKIWRTFSYLLYIFDPDYLKQSLKMLKYFPADITWIRKFCILLQTLAGAGKGVVLFRSISWLAFCLQKYQKYVQLFYCIYNQTSLLKTLWQHLQHTQSRGREMVCVFRLSYGRCTAG